MPRISSVAAPAAAFFVIAGSAAALSSHVDAAVRCAFAAGVAAVIAAWLLAHAITAAAHEHAAATVAVAKHQARLAEGPRAPTTDELLEALTVMHQREAREAADGVVPAL